MEEERGLKPVVGLSKERLSVVVVVVVIDEELAGTGRRLDGGITKVVDAVVLEVGCGTPNELCEAELMIEW